MHPGVKVGEADHSHRSSEKKDQAHNAHENSQQFENHEAVRLLRDVGQNRHHMLTPIDHALAFSFRSRASISFRETVRLR